jgi:hypothetical protein
MYVLNYIINYVTKKSNNWQKEMPAARRSGYKILF